MRPPIQCIMSFILFAATFVFAGIGIMVYAICHAPGGYEDRKGFHQERRS